MMCSIADPDERFRKLFSLPAATTPFCKWLRSLGAAQHFRDSRAEPLPPSNTRRHPLNIQRFRDAIKRVTLRTQLPHTAHKFRLTGSAAKRLAAFTTPRGCL